MTESPTNINTKKESEGKSKKTAKIAGLNKFLKIYYARVNEAYRGLNNQLVFSNQD